MNIKHSTNYSSRLIRISARDWEYRVYSGTALVGGGYGRSQRDARQLANLDIAKLDRGVNPYQWNPETQQVAA